MLSNFSVPQVDPWTFARGEHPPSTEWSVTLARSEDAAQEVVGPSSWSDHGKCTVRQGRGVLFRDRRDDGAAAVEFALILPLLMLVLFGIIAYGMWFNTSISVRQGVRESARMAVVQHTESSCTAAGAGMAAVACSARAQMVTSGGTAYAKVFARDGSWTRGNELVVCGMVKAELFTGLIPMPAGGLIKSQTTMSIESTNPLPADTSYADAPPSGGDWTWCV